MKLFCAMLFLMSMAAHSQVSGELGLHSNYLWRGTTFSDNQPVVQLDLRSELSHGLYAGTFVSNATIVDPSRDKMTHEVDVFIGKVWQVENWKLNVYYNKYYFPNAGVYDTHEYVAHLDFDRYFFRLSQMDNFFGYNSVYRYVRTGKEWTYKEGLDGGLYLGYNTFSAQKNAGNTNYVDISWTNKKQLTYGTALLTVNWTDRQLYTDSGKEKANDLLFIVGYTSPLRPINPVGIIRP
jgi:uncharacterized protein (TIGR02001 family)